MNLYRYDYSGTYVAAPNKEEAVIKISQSDVFNAFLADDTNVSEVQLPEGCTLSYIASTGSVSGLDRDQLKQWLSSRKIEFTPQWGVEKLRELAFQHA